MVCISFLLAGCTNTEVIRFNLKPDDIIFTVDPQIAGDKKLVVQGLKYNLDSALSANGMDRTKMTKIKITELYFDILQGDATFDVFDYITTTIETTTLPASALASKNPMPKDGVKSMPFDVSGSLDLRPFLDQTIGIFSAKTTVNTTISKSLLMRCRMTFQVEGQL